MASFLVTAAGEFETLRLSLLRLRLREERGEGEVAVEPHRADLVACASCQRSWSSWSETSSPASRMRRRSSVAFAMCSRTHPASMPF